ncbi:hypothetical protein [Absidia glauca]|uniref:Uncharacterized protein n=1 Tax=Absidia glauca TaxID=4829 RepID=A0A168QGY5_ABSGL|nr:hypothetical protein [Absidia glauca]
MPLLAVPLVVAVVVVEEALMDSMVEEDGVSVAWILLRFRESGCDEEEEEEEGEDGEEEDGDEEEECEEGEEIVRLLEEFVGCAAETAVDKNESGVKLDEIVSFSVSVNGRKRGRRRRL